MPARSRFSGPVPVEARRYRLVGTTWPIAGVALSPGAVGAVEAAVPAGTAAPGAVVAAGAGA